MRSKVKRLMGGAHDQQPLLKFIDDAMVVADRKHVLEVCFAAVNCCWVSQLRERLMFMFVMIFCLTTVAPATAVCVCVCVWTVQSDYGDELSLLYSWQEDYDRAKYYANMARDVFYQVRFSVVWFLNKITLFLTVFKS